VPDATVVADPATVVAEPATVVADAAAVVVGLFLSELHEAAPTVSVAPRISTLSARFMFGSSPSDRHCAGHEINYAGTVRPRHE
jgi:hypothetical protein